MSAIVAYLRLRERSVASGQWLVDCGFQGWSDASAVGVCDREAERDEPGEADEQGPCFVEAVGECAVEQDAGAAVARQQSGQSGRFGCSIGICTPMNPHPMMAK